MQSFKSIVVGRGLMGAAAARHLAKQSDGVAVIGPDEPEDPKTHDGVFASHYDEGRITRTIDWDADWSLLANRSIARYAEIEEESGISFFGEKGCLIAGPARGGKSRSIESVLTVLQTVPVPVEVLEPSSLEKRFPFFSLGRSEGVFEAVGAGHVSPRRLVRAQSKAAENAGATVIKQTVISVRQEDGYAVARTKEGESFRAEKVLLATGGFSIAENLLAEPVQMVVMGRTILLSEVSDAVGEEWASMPSLIFDGETEAEGIYLLPPVRYPDGRLYLKIGGDPHDIPLQPGQLRDWFRSDGDADTAQRLSARVKQIIPSLAPLSQKSVSCVTSYGPTGYPMIGYTASPHIAVMTGGCGASAKSSVEIGRLGAELLLTGRINDSGYRTDFSAHFRA